MAIELELHELEIGNFVRVVGCDGMIYKVVYVNNKQACLESLTGVLENKSHYSRFVALKKYEFKIKFIEGGHALYLGNETGPNIKTYTEYIEVSR